MASTIFLMMMRETITPERLSPLFNRRILMFNVGMMSGALGFGFMLEHVPFPTNYSLMFLGAFVFGMFSLWHVVHVKRLEQAPRATATTTSTLKAVSVVTRRPLKEALRDKRLLSVLLMVIIMHFAQSFISAPQPMHLANLGAKEGFLAVLGLLELAASGLITLVLQYWLEKWGAKRVMIGALVSMSIASFLIANAPALWVTLIGAALGGASWTCGSIAVLEFYTQRTDRSDVQATMLWHQLLFLSMFVGPMVGSMVVKMGVSPFHTMMIGGALRLICAVIAVFGLAWIDRKASQEKESKAKYA
jgi:MFS family permease